jgi:hypothetical protein
MTKKLNLMTKITEIAWILIPMFCAGQPDGIIRFIWSYAVLAKVEIRQKTVLDGR